MDRSHAYDDLQEVPVTPALANNVSEDHLLSQLVDDGPPPLEADDSSLIGTFPRPVRVPGPTSPPLNASTAALSGLTSSVHFRISAHPPVSHGVLATPSTSGRATSETRVAGDTANEEDESAETGDSDLPSLQSVFDSLSDEGDDDVLAVREPEEAEHASSYAPHNHAVPTSSPGAGATPDVRPTSNVFRGPSQSSQELREGASVLIPASDPPGWLSEFANRHGLADSSDRRAETLIKCMEVVPDELVLRYEKLRSADSEGVDGCAICQDDLVSKSPDTTELEVPHAGASLAFPCAGKHLFHTRCLSPWLAQKTTCPSCRFDIDPGRRMLLGLSRGWQPPLVESMRDWLAAEEKAKETGVRRGRPGVVMPEYPAIPPPPSPPPAGADFEEFGDLDVLMSGSESRLNFERDFAAWFDPEKANSL
ncbi:hypothetical protein LXA43DRAFT_536721 [Ganoderma leucocontextum]|nr:hypothetical protein LXA43DRAFT_536721 [Ganoderma leucocontextum]